MSSRTSTPLIVMILLGLLTMPGTALAQSDDSPEPSGTIGATTGRILNEAIEFLNVEDYASARESIGRLKLDRLSPYERSRVEQILSSIDNAEGNYGSSRQHLQNAIAAGGMNEQETSQARYNIAQLYMIEEKWAEGAAALEEWFRTTDSPNSAAYYLLAVAYYQQEDLQRALAPAQKAVELTDRPQASWIELLLALYLDREDFRSALPLSERLVAMDPTNKSYWVRLASLYQAVEDHDKAAATLQLAYNAGLLAQDSEYRRLADLLRFTEIPERCARILQRGLEDDKVEADADLYEKLANCWISAREFDEAIPPLERAAELSDNGDLFVRLAEVHLQREDWGAVVAALRKAVDKGDLKDTPYAELLMGIALYNQEELSEARRWFLRAAKSDERRKTANDYIRVIDSKVAS
ncbi:MAG TPA: tetratricopeptide repeat protein [Pseudomonadales bacterium]